MKIKKILMLLMLFIFIGAIAFVILQVNKKSVEKNEINTQIQENRDESSDGIIEIKDDYFIGATNDVYYNLDKYIGKTIKMKGLIYVYEAEGETCHAVHTDLYDRVDIIPFDKMESFFRKYLK